MRAVFHRCFCFMLTLLCGQPRQELRGTCCLAEALDEGDDKTQSSAREGLFPALASFLPVRIMGKRIKARSVCTSRRRQGGASWATNRPTSCSPPWAGRLPSPADC